MLRYSFLHLRPILCLTAAVLTAMVLPAGPGRAEADGPWQILEKAEARYRELTDYECLVEAEARNGKKHESGTYRFWFRKPAMMKIRVTGGKSRGSDLVIDEQGRIKGRKGGLLKAIVISLSRNDHRLRNVRGNPVWELEWGAFYRKLRERASRPNTQFTLSPASGNQPHELVLRYTEGGKNMREVYHLDPRDRVLLLADFFEDNQRVEHVRFSEIRLNPGLENRFFRL